MRPSTRRPASRSTWRRAARAARSSWRSPTAVPACPPGKSRRSSRSSTASARAAAPGSGSRSAAPSSRPTAAASGPGTVATGVPSSGSPCPPASRHGRPRAPMTEARPDPCVVVVEDEPQIRRFVRAALAGQGFRVHEAATGADGLVEVASRQPDIVILDLGLPDMDGLDVIRKVREWSAVPIIVLSARGQERDKVTALDAGADDYVSKPFGAGELLARIRVALRHTAGASHEADDAVFQVAALRVDLLRRQVFVGDREIHLTPIEYRLLTTLVHHAGKVVTHQQVLREVWGPSHTEQAHYVRVYMAHLRQKLEVEPARPRYLLTEPGVGYRLAAE